MFACFIFFCSLAYATWYSSDTNRGTNSTTSSSGSIASWRMTAWIHDVWSQNAFTYYYFHSAWTGEKLKENNKNMRHVWASVCINDNNNKTKKDVKQRKENRNTVAQSWCALESVRYIELGFLCKRRTAPTVEHFNHINSYYCIPIRLCVKTKMIIYFLVFITSTREHLIVFGCSGADKWQGTRRASAQMTILSVLEKLSSCADGCVATVEV